MTWTVLNRCSRYVQLVNIGNPWHPIPLFIPAVPSSTPTPPSNTAMLLSNLNGEVHMSRGINKVSAVLIPGER